MLVYSLFIIENARSKKQNRRILHTIKEERDILHKIKRREANWVDDTLRRNCLLKQVIDGKIGGKERRGRCSLLLYELND